MFGLFRRENPYEQAALAHYQAALERARDPVFYAEYGVPDTMDGRFDMLMVQLFPLLHSCARRGEREFAQAIFDAVFHNMDQTLRQIGFGDMGIPKRMKRMMKAFNGRMHAYEKGWERGDLAPALMRNLYGAVPAPSIEIARRMADYMGRMIEEAERAETTELRACA